MNLEMKLINYIKNKKEGGGGWGKGNDDVAIKSKLHKCEVFLQKRRNMNTNWNTSLITKSIYKQVDLIWIVSSIKINYMKFCHSHTSLALQWATQEGSKSMKLETWNKVSRKSEVNFTACTDWQSMFSWSTGIIGYNHGVLVLILTVQQKNRPRHHDSLLTYMTALNIFC